MIVSNSYIGAVPVLPDGTPPLPEVEGLRSTLSFAYFDKLYAQAPEQYHEMLDLYLHEYNLYRQEIGQAFEDRNEATFRRIKHKIIYSLHLLDLTALHHNMEALARQWHTLDAFEFMTAAQAYQAAFQMVLQAIAAQRDRLTCLPAA